MARLVIDPESRHPLERACERCKVTVEQARAAIAELEKVVAAQAPDDWRFTTSPVAKFLIAYEPDGPDCRFLGRTYRDRNRAGAELVERMGAATVSAEELKAVAREYRRLLLDPDCEIIHELKTCYSRDKDLSDEKRLFEGMKSLLPHVVPVEARRVAQRPNAMVVRGELWARQGEFLDLSTGPKAYEDILLFICLNASGIDRTRRRLYSLDSQGNLEFREESAGRETAPSAPAIQHPPTHRSQSYWMVPTYLDAVYIDLGYARRQWAGDNDCYRLDAEKMLLFSRLEALLRPLRPNKNEF